MTDTQDRLFTGTYAAREAAGDNPQRFSSVIDDRNAGRLQIPEHQRDSTAWTDEKRRRYVNRLKRASDGCHPPGSFVTYQTGPGPSYLNDGQQRLATLIDLRDNPQKYDLDQQGAESLLTVKISVQHRWYDSHEDAMLDFQLINDGTPLTPYELCHGILQYARRYAAAWKPMLESVERSVRDSEARLTGAPKQGRKQDHQRNRDVWAICHRFLSGERRASDYPDLHAVDPLRFVEKGQTVEHKLRDLLEDQGPDKVEPCIKMLRKFLESETSTLEECLVNIHGRPGMPMSPAAHRWLIHVAIWRRNNNISRSAYEEFATRVLTKTTGSYWTAELEDGTQFKATLGTAKLSLLPRIAVHAGMPDFARPEPRKRPRGRLMPGYDHSHIQPYVTNGDGPTFPEPAPRNRARGARPVENPPPGHSPGDQQPPAGEVP